MFFDFRKLDSTQLTPFSQSLEFCSEGQSYESMFGNRHNEYIDFFEKHLFEGRFSPKDRPLAYDLKIRDEENYLRDI